jgi:hypothetical protein
LIAIPAALAHRRDQIIGTKCNLPQDCGKSLHIRVQPLGCGVMACCSFLYQVQFVPLFEHAVQAKAPAGGDTAHPGGSTQHVVDREQRSFPIAER